MKTEKKRFDEATNAPSNIFPSLKRVIISKENVLKVVKEPKRPVLSAKFKFTEEAGQSIFESRKKIKDPNKLTKSVPVQKILN